MVHGHSINLVVQVRLFFQNEQEKNIFKPLFANHKGKPIMTRKGNRKV
jgi:hypothetical protein